MTKPIKYLDCKIAGIKYKNNDGTKRKDIIKKVVPEELLKLEREPNNIHDKNAIKVLNKSNEQLGYLFSEDAKEIASFLDKAGVITCKVNYLTKSSCHLKLVLYPAGTNEAAVTSPPIQKKSMMSLIKNIFSN